MPASTAVPEVLAANGESLAVLQAVQASDSGTDAQPASSDVPDSGVVLDHITGGAEGISPPPKAKNIAEELSYIESTSFKPLNTKDMSDWSKEGDDVEKFLELSQHELDELNGGAAVKSELETSSTLLLQAQSTPVHIKPKLMSVPGSNIPKFGQIKTQKRKDVTPPSGSLDQKKAKPPQVS